MHIVDMARVYPKFKDELENAQEGLKELDIQFLCEFAIPEVHSRA